MLELTWIDVIVAYGGVSAILIGLFIYFKMQDKKEAKRSQYVRKKQIDEFEALFASEIKEGFSFDDTEIVKNLTAADYIIILDALERQIKWLGSKENLGEDLDKLYVRTVTVHKRVSKMNPFGNQA